MEHGAWRLSQHLQCGLIRPFFSYWGALDGPQGGQGQAPRARAFRSGRRSLLARELDEDIVEAGLLETEFDEADAPLVGEHVAEDHAHPLVAHVARDGAAVSLQVAHSREPVAEELHSAGDNRLA